MVLPTKNKSIRNKNSIIQVLDNGILHVLYPEGTQIEVADIKELQTQFNKLDPKPTKVIQELRPYVNMTNEARKYGAEHSPALKGVAYVIHGLSQRLLVRFYIKMLKRDKPTKVFDAFNEALAWLEKL